jgi:hypothetical protein
MTGGIHRSAEAPRNREDKVAVKSAAAKCILKWAWLARCVTAALVQKACFVPAFHGLSKPANGLQASNFRYERIVRVR